MKKLVAIIVVFLGVSFLYGVDDEVSALDNPAQAQKATNLSEATQTATQEEIDTLEEAVTDAQEAYDADPTQENLDALNAAKDDLASKAGTSVEEINEMREAGMGWGEIAHEIGVHPGVLGNKKGSLERNSKGFSTTTASASKESSKGFGLSGKAEKAGKSSGNQGGSKSSGKGNSGNSNAGGNGKGGGKNK